MKSPLDLSSGWQRLVFTLFVQCIAFNGTAKDFSFPGQTITVPDGFEIELIAGTNLVPRPISADFDEQGHLYVTDSSGSNEKVAIQLEKKPHRVLRLEDSAGDGHFDRAVVFADQMMFPEGAMWLDGSLYVSAPPSIWKLTDTNGDGIADVREEWHQGKTLTACANDLHGPYLGPDGWIYWCKGAFGEQTYEINGKPFTTKAAHIFRARPDHSGMEPVLTGGMDNPVSVAFSFTGERFLAGTFFFQPTAGGVRDGVLHAIYGGVYGKVHPDVLDSFKRTGDLMPVMVQFPASASASVIRYRSGIFGKEFQDNLFVANFNLHNVTRHILQPDGATFKTTDSVFVSSDDPDFHPTCVLEDADGSLLIVDTGGWYKICCPTSQLYKPEHLGAIYRVRKIGSPKIDDPRGLKLSWATMKVPELISLLDDKRYCVRTHAVHELAKHGDAAVAAFISPTSPPTPESLRNKLWAATQIDSSKARDFIRRGLESDDKVSRSIALHSVSLWRDKLALPRVIQFLGSNEPPVRRIAAEAAGRIGDAQAVPALLAATAMPTDRVLEHSLIYALIEINNPAATTAGLDSTNSETRRCALIALDQMDSGKLEAKNVTPLLGSSDPALKKTASWILDHHNDWGDAASAYFFGEVFSGGFNEEVKNQIIQSARNDSIQRSLAEFLQGESQDHKLAALQVIAGTSLPEAPASWPAEVAHILSQKNPGLVRDAVLAARAITPKTKELNDALAGVAADGSQPIDVRLNAIVARPNGHAIEPALFDLCVAQTASTNAVAIRVLACGALTKAQLTHEQFFALSAAMKTVGPLELNKLLGSFERSTNEAVGLKLITDLKGANAVGSLHADRIKTLFEKYPAAVQKSAEPLIAMLNVDSEKQAAHINELLASLKNGDRDRGQRIFVSAKASCTACHCIGYIGGHVGPDLTRIGQIRTQRDLLEAIVYPSASFVRGFEPMIVSTKSGDDYSGIVKKDTPDEMILVTGPNVEAKIARADITNIRPGTISVMPEGLTTQMTAQELSDLITFLQSLH